MSLSLGPAPHETSAHYAPRRTRRVRPRSRLQPSMIPMVDVSFQLLLFFMLTMTIRQEGQIPASLPQAGGIVAARASELKPVRIALRPAGEGREGCVYEMSDLGRGLESPAQLYDALLARRDAYESDEVPIVIQPRDDVRWQYVVEAFNQATRAKFKHVGLVPPQ